MLGHQFDRSCDKESKSAFYLRFIVPKRKYVFPGSHGDLVKNKVCTFNCRASLDKYPKSIEYGTISHAYLLQIFSLMAIILIMWVKLEGAQFQLAGIQERK